MRKTPNVRLRILLRLGAFELLVAREAPHGVVDSYVRLAKSDRHLARGAGLVNAVLRKLSEEAPEEISSTQKLPQWLRKPMLKAYGAEAVAKIETAHQAGPAIDVTLRDGEAALDGKTLPTGSIRLPQGVQVSAQPGFADGAFWVQDTAAALPAKVLGDVADQRVLDLCAAPGGKTMQLCAAGARVTALDVSEARLKRLHDNLDRTGLTADVICADAFTWDGGPFDAILLDAPCSATGTIRRHPELPYIRSAKEVEELTRLQMRLIDRALTWLSPNGRMVYCTCSLLPNEGENQIKAALKRHEDLQIVALRGVDFGGDETWQSAEGGLRLRPDFWSDLGGMDGFYIALLKRR